MRIRREVYKNCGKKLSIPVFDLNPDINTKWGSWNPSTRLMTFSSKLFRNFELGAFEYVMRHEIAHQIVSEIFDMDAHGISHGEAWERACKLVNIIPKHCSSSTFLSQFKGNSKSDMVEKVSKLLIHGNDSGCTEHEAEAFMSKAKELMLRHDIVMGESDQTDRVFIKRPFGLNYKRFPAWMWTLGRLLESNYNVKNIRTYFYKDDVKHLRLELFGEPSNLDIAEYVGHALMAQAEVLYDKFRKERALEVKTIRERDGKNAYIGTKISKAAFMDGLLNGYSSTLRQSKKETLEKITAEDGQVIPMYDSNLLKELHGKAYSNMTFTNISGSCGAGRGAGMKAGKGMKLAKGVNSNGNRQRQLTS